MLYIILNDRRRSETILGSFSFRLPLETRKRESQIFEKPLDEINEFVILQMTQILPKVICLKYYKRFDLGSSVIRIEEYCESRFDQFFHHYFTLPEFVKVWKTTYGEGKFTYIEEFEGFNFPGTEVMKFNQQYRHDLTLKEAFLFNCINQIVPKEKIHDNYFIAYALENRKNESIVRDHEISHALYYLDREYRNACQRILNNMPEKKLQKKGKWKSSIIMHP
jgi:hypothetical protein